MVVKIIFEAFQNLNRNILSLKNITIVYLVENIKKSVIIILFDQLTMKSVFKMSKNLHYRYLMINDVA